MPALATKHALAGPRAKSELRNFDGYPTRCNQRLNGIGTADGSGISQEEYADNVGENRTALYVRREEQRCASPRKRRSPTIF